MVTLFLEGLRKRSKYAVGTKSYQPAGQTGVLERGDLVRLAGDHTGDTLMTSQWCSGKARPEVRWRCEITEVNRNKREKQG